MKHSPRTRQSFFLKGWAGLLCLSLTVPSPALALRPQPDRSGLEESLGATLRRPEVSGGKATRWRWMFGDGGTYDAFIRDYFPSVVVPELARGLGALYVRLERESEQEQEEWIAADAGGGFGFALEEALASGSFSRMHAVLADAVAWKAKDVPGLAEKLREEGNKRGLGDPFLPDRFGKRWSFRQGDVAKLSLKEPGQPPLRVITALAVLGFSPDPLGTLVHLYNQLEALPEDRPAFLLANVVIPTEHSKAAEIVAFYQKQVIPQLRSLGIGVDVKLTDVRSTDAVAQKRKAGSQEFQLGLVLVKWAQSPQQIKRLAQAHAEPFLTKRSDRTAEYQVVQYESMGEKLFAAAGLEEGDLVPEAGETVAHYWDRVLRGFSALADSEQKEAQFVLTLGGISYGIVYRSTPGQPWDDQELAAGRQRLIELFQAREISDEPADRWLQMAETGADLSARVVSLSFNTPDALAFVVPKTTSDWAFAMDRWVPPPRDEESAAAYVGRLAGMYWRLAQMQGMSFSFSTTLRGPDGSILPRRRDLSKDSSNAQFEVQRDKLLEWLAHAEVAQKFAQQVIPPFRAAVDRHRQVVNLPILIYSAGIPAAGLEEKESKQENPRPYRTTLTVHPGEPLGVMLPNGEEVGLYMRQTGTHPGRVIIPEPKGWITYRERSLQEGAVWKHTLWKTRVKILPLKRSEEGDQGYERWVEEVIYFFPVELVEKLLGEKQGQEAPPQVWRVQAPLVFQQAAENPDGSVQVEVYSRQPLERPTQVQLATGLEEGAGYVVVEGVGLVVPANLPAERYYAVAVGTEQPATLIHAGRAPGRIIAVATRLDEIPELSALGVPGDQIVQAWEWPTLEAAKDYAIRLGREWLAGLHGLRVSVLEVTARSLRGIWAQLQEMLPSAWQTVRPITAEDTRRVLDLAA